jgi:aspartate/glutamate racemase
MKAGETAEQLQKRWKTLKPLLTEAGVEAVLIACTDLSPLSSRLFTPEGFHVIDSSLALARATVRTYLESSGRDPKR